MNTLSEYMAKMGNLKNDKGQNNKCDTYFKCRSTANYRFKEPQDMQSTIGG